MALKPTSPPKHPRLPPTDHVWASPSVHRRHKQPAVGNANTVFLGKEFDSLEHIEGAPILDLPIDLRCAVAKQPARSALTEALRKMSADANPHSLAAGDAEAAGDDGRCDSDSNRGRRAGRAADGGAEGAGSSGPDEGDDSPTSQRSLPGWFV